MSDDLLVSGGGSISVGTPGLFAHARLLENLERELRECALALEGRESAVRSRALAGTSASAARAEDAIDDASEHLRAAATKSGALSAALRLTADAYGMTESTLQRLARSAASEVGIGLGFLSTTVGLLLIPGILSVLAGGASAYLLIAAISPTAASGVRKAGVDWLNENKVILSDPRFVQLVRLAVMSADDFGGGALRLPTPVIRLFGDEGLGLLGLDTSAATIASAAGLVGLARETPVAVRATAIGASTPATGLADRASRVPRGSAQVRIDRHVRKGGPDRFEVYLGGTIDFSLAATDEPWDMTSNLGAIAGADAGAYRAVTEALQAAGVRSDSEIVVTGYSQGGLLGSMLAASGDYDVRGLYTLGAPVGQVPVPGEIPWVAIEHTDDIVPAVGGTWSSSDPVLVRREAFSDKAPDPKFAVPAHQLSHYRHTAELADAAGEGRLVQVTEAFSRSMRGADRVESTWYEANRLPG